MTEKHTTGKLKSLGFPFGEVMRGTLRYDNTTYDITVINARTSPDFHFSIMAAKSKSHPNSLTGWTVGLEANAGLNVGISTGLGKNSGKLGTVGITSSITPEFTLGYTYVSPQVDRQSKSYLSTVEYEDIPPEPLRAVRAHQAKLAWQKTFGQNYSAFENRSATPENSQRYDGYTGGITGGERGRGPYPSPHFYGLGIS